MGVYPEGYGVKRSADLSDCGTYRYRLIRQWSAFESLLPFIMLNPSTADADIDDPTIRRCVGFAHRLGFGGVGVWNLYAYRATKPADLWRAGDPIGPDNDRRLRNLFQWAHIAGRPVVAAWGANAKPERVRHVLAMDGAANLRCLGLTKQGAPRHPLYVSGDSPLVPLFGTTDERGAR